jgi:hypothetical protein
MQQTLFKLQPIVQQEVPGDVSFALRSLYDSIHFDFPGRINKERRPKQFQYRFGIKVQPRDRRLDATFKRKNETVHEEVQIQLVATGAK